MRIAGPTRRRNWLIIPHLAPETQTAPAAPATGATFRARSLDLNRAEIDLPEHRDLHRPGLPRALGSQEVHAGSHRFAARVATIPEGGLVAGWIVPSSDHANQPAVNVVEGCR